MTYKHLDSYRNMKVLVKYVMDCLVMCGIRVNTHSHRAYFIKYQRVSNFFFSGFASRFLRLISSQHSSAPPCGGYRSIASSYYGVIGRHSSCLIRNAVFFFIKK